jgi:hypothetical protein
MADQALPCQLDLVLVYELLGEERASLLYPVNVLRNYARLQVVKLSGRCLSTQTCCA